MNREHIRIEQISKRFGSIQALKHVSLSVNENEILALIGDNGAGKTTLIKILSGVLTPDSGVSYINGEPANFDGYPDARAAGIETVFQTLAIAPQQSVKNNIFLGKELTRDSIIGEYLSFVNDEQMTTETVKLLNILDINISPHAKAGRLSGGQQQAVAIARALQSKPEILIMDEPTSKLSVESSQLVLDLIQRMQNHGLTIVLADHNINEVLSVADRVAVLSSGRLVGTRSTDTLTEENIIQMMMNGTTH